MFTWIGPSKCLILLLHFVPASLFMLAFTVPESKYICRICQVCTDECDKCQCDGTLKVHTGKRTSYRMSLTWHGAVVICEEIGCACQLTGVHKLCQCVPAERCPFS